MLSKIPERLLPSASTPDCPYQVHSYRILESDPKTTRTAWNLIRFPRGICFLFSPSTKIEIITQWWISTNSHVPLPLSTLLPRRLQGSFLLLRCCWCWGPFGKSGGVRKKRCRGIVECVYEEMVVARRLFFNNKQNSLQLKSLLGNYRWHYNQSYNHRPAIKSLFHYHILQHHHLRSHALSIKFIHFSLQLQSPFSLFVGTHLGFFHQRLLLHYSRLLHYKLKFLTRGKWGIPYHFFPITWSSFELNFWFIFTKIIYFSDSSSRHIEHASTSVFSFSWFALTLFFKFLQILNSNSIGADLWPFLNDNRTIFLHHSSFSFVFFKLKLSNGLLNFLSLGWINPWSMIFQNFLRIIFHFFPGRD